MRKILLPVLASSLLLASFVLRADILLADATQNFGAARTEVSAPATPPPVATPVVAPATTPVIQPVNAEAAQIAQEEVLRRQVAQIEARVLIDVGCRLENEGKHEEAIAKIEEGLKILPRAKATEADYNRAVRALSAAYIQLADKALKAGDKTKAIEQAKKAIEYDPTNRQAENIFVKAKQIPLTKPAPLAPTLDKTPEFLAAREQIKKLFREGKILLNSGQFDEAERHFQQILMLDPYNADAQEMLKMVNDARQPSTYAGQEVTHHKMLWQADNAWLLPTSGDIKRPEQEQTSVRLENTGLNKAIMQKMSEIKFPEINFREASLVDVVTYLSEQSRKLDEPKHEGVNIVLGPGVSGGTETAPAPAAGADAAAAAATTPAASGTGGRSITLQLHNIPMLDALKLIVPLAGLKYRVDSYAVVLLPTDAPDEEMTTESYGVSPDAFTKYAVTAGADTGGGGAEKMTGGTVTQVSIDLKALFKDAGVEFPPGSSITFNQKTSKIIIRNTPKNIEAFLKVLPSFDAVPTQVEIEARFIDINQTDLDELGFDWQFSGGRIQGSGIGGNATPSSPAYILYGGPNGTMGPGQMMRDSSGIGGDPVAKLLTGGSGTVNDQLFSIGGVFNGAAFKMIIKALAQKGSTDLLSAPKVTTLSTVEATVKVVQSFIYPSEYSEPTASTGTQTPAVPSGFKTKDIGVILRVTPTVSADKNTIDLMLTPEVTEFLGFIDYSPGPISNTVAATAGPPPTAAYTQVMNYPIKQPLFSERSVATRVVVWDGQTVVLGGLIKENIQKIDDKIPFLGDLPLIGRFFRSKVTTRTKENLLIFVTARLIGPDGNPIHKEVIHGGLR